MTDCGYTPAEICELTLDDVRDLFDYWRTYPPLRDLVAGFVGFKPKPSAQSAPISRNPSTAELKLLYPDGLIRG